MAVDWLTVNVLHVFGEERSDVFIRTPIQWDAQVVAVLGFEFFFQICAIKQVGAEPVKVGKLLVGQLVELFVRTGGKAGADEVFDVKARIGPLFARTRHVVGQIQNLAIAVVGPDQVGVSDPAVIN